MDGIAEIETQRQIIQRELDRLKTQEQRNILGQFSTPMVLAHDILRNALKIMSTSERIRFLDPAIGTGAFFSALNHICVPTSIEAATGYEIDAHYGKPAIDLWSASILDYQLNDFTKVAPPIDESQKVF